MEALIFFPFLSILIPLLITFRTYSAIDEYKFKLYKIKYFWFLFPGIHFVSSKTHGTILPLPIMQISGYLSGIASLLIIWLHEVHYIFEENTVLAFVQINFAAHGLIWLITLFSMLYANEKRTKFLRKKSKNRVNPNPRKSKHLPSPRQNLKKSLRLKKLLRKRFLISRNPKKLRYLKLKLFRSRRYQR